VSTTTSPLALSGKQFNALLRLMNLYHREALKCLDAKAYTAGAVMVGAALESSLLALVYLREEEVIAWPRIPRKQGRIKPQLEWDLATLLKAADYAGWLPRQIPADQEFSHRNAGRGDYATLLRVFRNLVHPHRYIEDFGSMRMTRKRLDFLLDVLGHLSEHLAMVAFRPAELEDPDAPTS
jgi:hypothetical protein